MKTVFTKKQTSLAVACALAFGFVSGPVLAQNLTPNENRDTWAENSRTQIWRNAHGECWRNMYGPPPGYGECNPAPIARVTAPAPVVVIPAPARVAAPPPPPAPVIEPAPLPPRRTRG